MKKIFKGLGLGFITLALILVGGVQVSADLTVAALAVTSSAAITVSSTTASAATFDSGTTGAVNIGTGASAKTVTVGNATTTTALALNSGTGDMTLTSTDDVSILGGSAGSIINIGTNVDGNAINVGTDNTAADTIIVGSALDNVDLAGEDIALTSADDIHILGGSAGSIINIGTNVDGNAINVGTDNTAADTIVIGSALDTSSLAGIAVTVGSTGTTSALTLQSGTGDVTVTSTDDFIFTATDDITISGNSAAGILNLGTGNDGFAINVGTDNTAADTIIVGSALDNVDLAGEDIALTSADDIHILGGSAGSIINIGTNVDGNAINVGTDNTAADTIVIGSALDTSSLLGISVTVGSAGTTSALALNSGTGDMTLTSVDDISILGGSAGSIINIGTNVDGNAINVGTDNTAADTIIIGSALDNVDLAGEDIALTSADDIHILGGSAGSIINIGTNVDGNAINVGTDNTAADTIIIGSALDNVDLAGEDIALTSADDITISGNSAAGILNLGTGNDGYVINVGTDNTAADAINIGSALDTTTVAGILVIPASTGLADAACTTGRIYFATTTANAMTANHLYVCNAAGNAWVDVANN